MTPLFARTRSRTGFTLLEVIVALGIMALGLVVLIDTQASSALAAVDADRTVTTAHLAEEKLMEVLLETEVEGFTDSDKEESGTFEEFGSEEWRGDDLAIDATDLENYHFAWTVRKIDLTLPTDLSSMLGDLEGVGYVNPDEMGEGYDNEMAPDLSDFGITPDMIADYLGDYIREVRVVVWYAEDGEDDDEPDLLDENGDLPDGAFELLTHVINPTGRISAPLGG
ncbi:MAG: type II secretion system protein [Alphaproteobacteria bacterium]|nr:type II secretion system protein [Alphaproteobacteria bacterium]